MTDTTGITRAMRDARGAGPADADLERELLTCENRLMTPTR